MLLQIPETMPEEHYAIGSLNLTLFIVWIVILYVFGIIFLIKSGKQEMESQKHIKRAFGLFGIFYGTCRVFFILMFHVDPDTYYNLLANVAYTFGMIGFTAIIWALEKIKYEKHYFFIISMIITLVTLAGVILLLLGLGDFRIYILVLIMFGTPIAGIFIIILYISLIKNTVGSVRKKAIYSLIGFLIMVVAITMDGQFILAIEWIPLWIKMDLVPILCIAGYLIFALNQL